VTGNCNADVGHRCDVNDGEPCERCAQYEAEVMAAARREYPQYVAERNYRQDMIDAGRGHLLRGER
jgi:hypothetical protein